VGGRPGGWQAAMAPLTGAMEDVRWTVPGMGALLRRAGVDRSIPIICQIGSGSGQVTSSFV